MQSRYPVVRILLSALFAASASGCGLTASSRFGDVAPGMTEQQTLRLLGPSAEYHVVRYVSRDSSLAVLYESGEVTTAWSQGMSDAELAALVAPGDTVSLKISTWEVRGTWPWQAPRRRTVHFSDRDGMWRVTSKKETRTDIVH